MHTLDGLALFGIHLEMIFHMNAPNYQHLTILLNLTRRFCGQKPFTGRNSARFQRATKCSRQSTTGGGDHIVERCSMWLVNIDIDFVMFGNL